MQIVAFPKVTKRKAVSQTSRHEAEASGAGTPDASELQFSRARAGRLPREKRVGGKRLLQAHDGFQSRRSVDAEDRDLFRGSYSILMELSPQPFASRLSLDIKGPIGTPTRVRAFWGDVKSAEKSCWKWNNVVVASVSQQPNDR